MTKPCCWCDEPATMTLVLVAADVHDPACDEHAQKYEREYDRIDEPRLASRGAGRWSRG